MTFFLLAFAMAFPAGAAAFHLLMGREQTATDRCRLRDSNP